MAWYRTGTLSLTNGSTSVTGSGTQFRPAAQAGDMLTVGGAIHEIASVNSDTSITLATAFTGTTATGVTGWAIVQTQSRTKDMNDSVSALVSDVNQLTASFSTTGSSVTMNVPLNLVGSATSAPVNIAPGVAPSSLLNGDLWTTSSGLFTRIAGTTQQMATVSQLSNYVPAVGGDLTGRVRILKEQGVYSTSGPTESAFEVYNPTQGGAFMNFHSFNIASIKFGMDENAVLRFGAKAVSLEDHTHTAYAPLIGSPTFTGESISIAPAAAYARLVLNGSGFVGAQSFSLRQGIVGVSNGGFSIRDETNGINRLAIGADGETTVSGLLRAPSYATASASTVGAGQATFSVPYTGDALTFGRTGPSYATQFGWIGPNQNYIYSGTEFRIGNSLGYVSVFGGDFFAGSAARFGTKVPLVSERYTFYNNADMNGIAFGQYTTADWFNTVFIHGRASGATAAYQAAYLNAAGGVVGSIVSTGSATSFNTTSDRRLKENIREAPSCDLIDAIRVVSHDWKAGGSVDFGVIAQELVEVVPNAVTPGDTVDDDEEVERPWSVDLSKLVPLLVKAVQELRTEVAALKASSTEA